MSTLCGARRVTWLVLAAALFAACAEPAIDVHVTQQRSDDGGTSLVVRATDRYTGDQLDVSSAEVEIGADGTFQAAEARMVQPADARLDVVLVADNSSDQKSLQKVIQQAADSFGNAVLDLGLEGRVGMVRVSTQARIVQPLTADPSDIDVAVQRLYVSNGWTALYDGVRLANEVLEDGDLPAPESPCASPVFRAIVAFTNGTDNNSADQHVTSYEGDDIDTSLADLKQLSVDGERTPVFNVGVGKRVDEGTLRELSQETGGHYAAISGYGKLQDELLSSARRVWDARLLCLEERATQARVRIEANTELGKTSETVVVGF